jgi:putative flippase GtrA
MTTTPVAEEIRNPHGNLARFAVVTAVATSASLASYLGLMRWSDMTPVACNLIAALALSTATFPINRRWVWSARPVDSIRRAAALYWLSSLVNVVVASIALAVLKSSGSAKAVTPVVPLAVYASLWLARFAFLDRVAFRSPVIENPPRVATESKVTLP